MGNRLKRTSANQLAAADVVDGTLVIRRLDGTKVKYSGGVGSESEGTPSGLVHAVVPVTYDMFANGTLVTLYEPGVGDTILDIWVDILESWNGIFPTGDVGTFVNSNDGLFSYGTALDMSAPADVEGNQGYGGDGIISGLSTAAHALSTYWTEEPGVARLAPFRMTEAYPLKMYISESGGADNGDPGSTQGAAVVHLLVLPA